MAKTKKYKHRINTIEGIVEFESDVPPTPPSPSSPPLTPEEEEAERQRLFPDTSKASYLQYLCYFCGYKFYRIYPYRNPKMNPISDGFFIFISTKKGKRLMFTCRNCLLELSMRDEEFEF
jgi:hypothetical protein